MSWTQLAVTGLIIIGLVVVCLTYQVWAAAFLGVLFAISLNGPAQWIRQRLPMPTWLATLIVLVCTLASLVGLGLAIGPSLASQAEDFTKELPDAAQKVLTWVDKRPWGQRLLQNVEDWSGVPPQEMLDKASKSGGEEDASSTDSTSKNSEETSDTSPDEQKGDSPEKENAGGSAMPDVTKIFKPIMTGLAMTANTATLLMVTLTMMLFVAFDPSVYVRGILWLVPSEQEALAKQTMSRLGVSLRWWMLGRLISMTAVGAFTSLGMWLIGMPSPLALGALAGLLSFVPNIGPIMAVLPGLLIGLSEGPSMVLWVLGVYIVAQIIESNVISPLVDQYAVSIPPGLLIITQVVLATLGGIWGIVVATPLLVVVMVLVQQLYIRERLEKPIEVTGSC